MEPTEDTPSAAPAMADTQSAEPEVSTETSETATEADEAPETTADGDTESDTSPEELKKREWRQQDYTRKTQEFAETRKAFDAERAEFTRLRDARLQQIDNAVQLASRALQADFAKVDWNTLANTDPAGYVQKQHEFSVRQAELNQAWQTLQQQRAQSAQEREFALQRIVAEQEAALLDAIPEWRDPVKGAAGMAEVRAFARSAGLSDQQFAEIAQSDIAATAVSLIRDAMRFRAVQRKIPQARPVSQTPPPPSKLASKSTGQKDPAEMTDAEFAAWRKRQIAQRR